MDNLPPIVASRPYRKFTIGDLMILVVGCSVGLAWLRAAGLDDQLSWPVDFASWRSLWRNWLQAPVPVLTSIGLATLICRFRSPRPPLRRLMRQPGTTALVLLALITLIVALVLLTGLTLEPLIHLRPSPNGRSLTSYPSKFATLAYQIYNAGKMIAACWFLQAISGRWKPERSWPDRTGRFLGVTLITLDLLALVGLALRV